MLRGIDHLVIATGDPDEAAALLERDLGLGASGGGRHDALGTFNRVVWLGDSYIELIGVFDRDRSKQTWIGQPTLAALKTGGGLATFALASDDLRADLDRLGTSGSRLTASSSGERRRADGRTIRWQVSLPPRLGPSEPPFLIEHDPAGPEWTPEDRATRAVEQHPIGAQVRLVTVDIPVPSVAALTLDYMRDLGLRFRPSLEGGGARDVSVGDHTIRLRPIPARRSGLAAIATIRLHASAVVPRQGDLLGCRWLIDPA